MTDSAPVLDALLRFIDSSPSPYHASATSAEALTGAGFHAHGADKDWDVDSPLWVQHGGALIAARTSGSIDPELLSFRLVGAHTDSPNLRIKPHPDTGNVGYQQLGVEVYGGVLLNSWLDRDLGLSGRVAISDDDGERVELFRADRPLLRVAQLAIHLDREVNEGLKLDKQTHMAPIWGLGETTEGAFRQFLAQELDTPAESLVAWDVMAHDLTAAARLGRGGEMYAAPRIDNLASCHAAVTALSDTTDLDDNTVAVIALFDHEEVGSESTTGAASPLLGHALERIATALGASRAQYLRALHRSWCVSADGAHAVHPNYPDRHEPNHKVQLNAGPVIKLNANVRYASDAASSARFQAACVAAGVPFQQYSHRTNLACGSTIGPITAAQLGMRVVDVGSAQLSMHSARELGGALDPAMLTAALSAFLRGA